MAKTFKSNASEKGGLVSISNDTSYGKEAVHENTIDQILGKIEKSNLGGSGHENFSKQQSDPNIKYRKKVEEKIFNGDPVEQQAPETQHIAENPDLGAKIVNLAVG